VRAEKSGMPQHLEPKKQHLLKIVVKEYIHSAMPVASLMLGETHGLQASSATLRNWMSELESLGYLRQPHASSGRIPTDQGYRHYVDTLMNRENLKPWECRLIRRELEAGFKEIEDVLRQVAEIVSGLGKCTAVILPPMNHDFLVKSLQLVRLDEEKILAVILTQSGLVLDGVVELACSAERIETLSNFLNEKLKGVSLLAVNAEILEAIADELETQLLARIMKLISEAVGKQNKMVVEGTHHLLSHPEFRDVDKFKNTLSVFKMRENQLSKFLGRLGSESDVHVFIGYENPLKDLQELSVISAPYKIQSQVAGALALVGPTRMDYDHLIPLIQYAAAQLSERLVRLTG